MVLGAAAGGALLGTKAATPGTAPLGDPVLGVAGDCEASIPRFGVFGLSEGLAAREGGGEGLTLSGEASPAPPATLGARFWDTSAEATPASRCDALGDFREADGSSLRPLPAPPSPEAAEPASVPRAFARLLELPPSREAAWPEVSLVSWADL